MMKIDQNTLFDLILAANYLNMKGRLDLRCQTVADMIKGKTPEKIARPPTSRTIALLRKKRRFVAKNRVLLRLKKALKNFGLLDNKSNMAGSSGADLRAPVFNGENFDFWQIKMKTIFRSHDLWDMVEKGYSPLAKREEELTATELNYLKENIVKDAKALGIIQGAVSDEIFPRIAILETAKEAWNILKQEFIGNKQVRSVKLQSLRRDFEYTRIGEHEAFSVYLVQLFDLITQMKSYGEDIGNQRIVQKFLISLPRSYDSIVAVIENTRDLETVDVQDVVDTLKGECWFKGKPQCHNCDKPGHFAKDCRSRKATQQANYAGRVENTSTMFYVCMAAAVKKNEDTWSIDSGCSNHMTRREDLLVNIEKSVTAKVEMGTGKLVNVVGKGELLVETK
ncbi:unnamed protein product [Malus baccata var. baccata]